MLFRSAERLQRNFAAAPPNARALVDECTGAIITEVESLKGLVDEFAQFARMRGPKLVAADLNALAADTVRLYQGVLQQGAIALVLDTPAAVPAVAEGALAEPGPTGGKGAALTGSALELITRLAMPDRVGAGRGRLIYEWSVFSS